MRAKLKLGRPSTDGDTRSEQITINVLPAEFQKILALKAPNESMGYFVYKIIKNHLDTLSNGT